MKNVNETKEELITRCTRELESIGYTDIEKADIDHDCFIARCKSPVGQTVVMEMPISIFNN